MRHRIAGALVLFGTAAALAPQPAMAQGSVTLANGAVDATEGFYTQSFFDFWKELRLDLTGADPTYTGSATGSAVSYDHPNTEITTSGQVNASYDREAELLRGTYSLTELEVFHNETAAGTEHMETTKVYQGRFRADLLPTDARVEVGFEGTLSVTITGDIPPGWLEDPNFSPSQTMDWDFSVTFDVTAQGITTDTTAAPTSLAPVQDSGARFTGVNGEVKALIPVGVDVDGRYVYGVRPDGSFIYGVSSNGERIDVPWDTEGANWTFPRWGDAAPLGTRIETGEDSSTTVALADGSTFTMKPEGEILIDLPESKRGNLELISGHLWMNFSKMLRGESIEITTDQAVLGIKGTTFVLEHDGATTTLKMIEGTVELTSLAAGDVQQVETGQLVVADSTGLGEVQPFDVAAETASWADLGVSTEAVPDDLTAGEVTADTDDSGSSSSAIVWVVAAAGLVITVVAGSLLLRRRKTAT